MVTNGLMGIIDSFRCKVFIFHVGGARGAANTEKSPRATPARLLLFHFKDGAVPYAPTLKPTRLAHGTADPPGEKALSTRKTYKVRERFYLAPFRKTRLLSVWPRAGRDLCALRREADPWNLCHNSRGKVPHGRYSPLADGVIVYGSGTSVKQGGQTPARRPAREYR